MQLVSLRETSLSESVPHRLFDIGRAHETAFNFRDSRDTFYNFDASRDKRTTQKTASQKIGSRLVKGKGIEISIRGEIGAKGSGSTSDFDNPGHLKIGRY